MFQLTESELEILKSQNATSSWGGRRTLPFAFTEHGILMLSSVLRSKEAIAVNIRIMRLFTRMRKLLMEQSELVLKLHRIEDAVENHNSEIQILYEHLRRLLEVTKKEIKQKQRKMIGY